MADQRAPSGLAAEGKALWAAMTDGLTYRPDELAVLAGACKLADTVAQLEKATKDAPLVVAGSKGQDTVNPLLQELRLTRAELTRQLARIDVPEIGEDGQARNSSRTSSRKSARARWHGEATG